MPKVKGRQVIINGLLKWFLQSKTDSLEAWLDQQDDDDDDDDGDHDSSSSTTSSLSSSNSTISLESDSLSSSSLHSGESSLTASTLDLVVGAVQILHSHRYLHDRSRKIRRTSHSLSLTLYHAYAHEHDEFRRELRMTPAAFDSLLQNISDDPVFYNKSINSQVDIRVQLAITLYRLGHTGNSASIKSVAKWAGCSVGLVDKCTGRVFTAILRPTFFDRLFTWPSSEDIEHAKKWVEERSCKAWRNGWCFVDGTLVNFLAKPYWYSETWFHRKCAYGTNLTVRQTPKSH